MKNHETYHEKKHDNLWNTMRQPWKTVGKAMVWWNQEKHFLISCQVQHACLPQAMLGTDVLCQVRSQSVFSSMPWPWAFIIFICSHGAIIVVHGHSPQPNLPALETCGNSWFMMIPWGEIRHGQDGGLCAGLLTEFRDLQERSSDARSASSLDPLRLEWDGHFYDDRWRQNTQRKTDWTYYTLLSTLRMVGISLKRQGLISCCDLQWILSASDIESDDSQLHHRTPQFQTPKSSLIWAGHTNWLRLRPLFLKRGAFSRFHLPHILPQSFFRRLSSRWRR